MVTEVMAAFQAVKLGGSDASGFNKEGGEMVALVVGIWDGGGATMAGRPELTRGGRKGGLNRTRSKQVLAS